MNISINIGKKYIAAVLAILNFGCVSAYLSKGAWYFIGFVLLGGVVSAVATVLDTILVTLIAVALVAYWGYQEAEKIGETNIQPKWTFWVWLLISLTYNFFVLGMAFAGA